MQQGRLILPKEVSQRAGHFRGCERHDLYLMGAFLDGTLLAYKIGISADCEKRRLSLERGSFTRISILCCFRCSCKGIAVYLEDVCCRDLKVFRLRGEWFRPVSQVCEVFDNKAYKLFHYMHDGNTHRCV